MEQTSKDHRKGSVLQSLQLEIIRTHKELHLQKFVHLHQNEHAVNIDMDTNDYCVPMEVDSALPPTQDDASSSQSSDEESRFEVDIQLQDILRLHKQVQDGI